MIHHCQHCIDDSHSPNIWPPKAASIQLRGVWLCCHHYETAIIVGTGGYLLGPDTARWYQEFIIDMIQ